MRWSLLLIIIVISLCGHAWSQLFPEDMHQNHRYYANGQRSRNRHHDRPLNSDNKKTKNSKDCRITTNDCITPEDVAEILEALQLPPDFGENKKNTKATNSKQNSDHHNYPPINFDQQPRQLPNPTYQQGHLHDYDNSPIPHHQDNQYTNNNQVAETGGAAAAASLVDLGTNSDDAASKYVPTITTAGHGWGHQGQGHSSDIFVKIIRLILQTPNAKLAALKPLILGLANTAAQTTQSAAGVNAHLAHHLPTITKVKGDVLKKWVQNLGDSSGSVLYLLAHVLSAAAAAKSVTAHKLPYAYNLLEGTTGHLTSTAGALVEGISGPTKIIAQGAIEAAIAKAKLAKKLVQAGQGFKSGVLEGVKNGAQNFNHINSANVHHSSNPSKQPVHASHVSGGSGHGWNQHQNHGGHGHGQHDQW